MTKKIIKIEYDPYRNHIGFNVSLDAGNSWQDLADTSELLKYQNQECVFSNCVEDIVSYLNQYQNSNADGLCIQFIGTDEDFFILESVAENENQKNTKKGKIQVERIGAYKSADEAISIIRDAYKRIAAEFDEYLPGKNLSEIEDAAKKIGTTISLFTKTISRDIPICVIGTYSVGKSAFINSIIGTEILPSKVDPCTAKDVKVENSPNVGISFEYRGEELSLEIKDENVVNPGPCSDGASKFLEDLKNYCSFCNKTATEILHDILVAFNESKNVFPQAADVGWNVSVRVPFVDSLLNQSDCKIVFFDTPGSNNSDIDQKAHRESLEKMMGEQTNALPIFVMDRNQVISNDNNEVKSLLDENKKGFSNPNCLIVFSKAENIPNAAFSQAIPPAFLNWHGKATFLYVCAVGAIGEKKKNNRWLDSEYEDGYKDWRLKFNSDHRSLPGHNIIPCGRVMEEEIRASVSDSLYATGIPSVEDEINYYVRRYANYKKCVNGQELLQKALTLAKAQLENQKKALANAKEKKEKEQKEKRQELIAELSAVTIKTVNIQYVIGQYQEVLDKYCDSVLPKIISIWDDAKQSKKPTEYILEHMQSHCNDNLYREAYEGPKGIQRQIVDILSDCANEYKAKLQAVVKGRKGILAEVAQEEISGLFLSIKTPDFESVGKGNPLFSLFDWFSLLRNAFEKKYLEVIATSICKQLRNQEGGLFKKDELGMFAEHCIQQPVKGYYEQLSVWKTTHLEKIKKTLDKENYILSQFDTDITNLEHQIRSLETRLWNLKDVAMVLDGVLESQGEVGK